MTHWLEGPNAEDAAYRLFSMCNRGESYYREFLILFVNTDETSESALLKCVPEQIDEARYLWGARELLASMRNKERRP